MRRIHGSHAAEQHRCVQEAVPPGQGLEVLVPPHPGAERKDNQRNHERAVPRHAPREQPAREETIRSTLVHGWRPDQPTFAGYFSAIQYRFLYPRKYMSPSTSAGDASKPSSRWLTASTSSFGPFLRPIVLPPP